MAVLVLKEQKDEAQQEEADEVAARGADEGRGARAAGKDGQADETECEVEKGCRAALLCSEEEQGEKYPEGLQGEGHGCGNADEREHTRRRRNQSDAQQALQAGSHHKIRLTSPWLRV